MKRYVKYIYIIFSVVFILYLLLPQPLFIEKLPGSLQSNEPADIETSLRRGYFTDLKRDEVMNYYFENFKKGDFINFPTYRLNYPPEEAQILIRDQTRSMYLEEIVHPFRESFFVSGFEPKLDKDRIVVDGKEWGAKVIVRYAPSNTILRVLAGFFTIFAIYFVYKYWVEALMDFKELIKN